MILSSTVCLFVGGGSVGLCGCGGDVLCVHVSVLYELCMCDHSARVRVCVCTCVCVCV